MLVVQQIKVLPAGVNFKITDNGKTRLDGFISESDKSVCFLSAYEFDLYYNVYSTFKVIELKAELGVIVDNKQSIDYVIEIRGE